MRYYSAVLGRFINKDPLGYLFGMNPYEYCAGNPGRYVDPFGLGWTDWFTAAYDIGANIAGKVVDVAVGVAIGVGVGVVAAVVLGPTTVLLAGAVIGGLAVGTD